MVVKEVRQRKEKQKFHYDRHTKPLENLVVGDSVMMQVKNQWKPPKVIAIDQNGPRSYVVQNSGGQTYRRNRRHLRKVSSANANHAQDDDYLFDDPWDDGSSADTSPNQPSPLTSTPLWRSQRTIRKPTRYSDLYY